MFIKRHCLYFVGWISYYIGISNPVVIISLTVSPCLAFILFALDRKNIIAVVPAVCFTICHLIYGTVNFIALIPVICSVDVPIFLRYTP